VLAAGIAVFAVAAPRAMATSVSYCSGFQAGSYATCYGTRHSITKNEVVGDYAVCAGAALDSGGAVGAFYGHYNCGGQSASHAYSGDNLLHPAAHNHTSLFNVLFGTMYY
jgi:hypothetical protein